MKIDIINYLPRQITPRKGKMRKLNILKSKNKIILKDKYCRKIIILNRFINFNNLDITAIGLYFAEGNKLVSENSENRHSGEIAFTNSYLKSIKCFLALMKKFQLKVSDFNWELGLNINYYQGSMQKSIEYWIRKLKLSKEKMYKPCLKGIIGGRLSNNTFKFGYIKISFGSVIFRSIFLSFINKILDDAILYKDKKILSKILNGYFAGDGHISFNKNSYRRVAEFLCNNKTLFNKLFTALNIIGCNNLKQTYPERTKTHSKAIRIYNKHDFEILEKFKIYDFVDYKANEFSKLIKSYKSKRK